MAITDAGKHMLVQIVEDLLQQGESGALELLGASIRALPSNDPLDPGHLQFTIRWRPTKTAEAGMEVMQWTN